MTRTISLASPVMLHRYSRRHDVADVSAATIDTALGHNDIIEADR